MKYLLWLSLLCLSGASMADAKAVPELKLVDLSGQQQKLSALRGSVVVLSFWATWCAPCKEELPRLSKLSERYTGRQIRFLAVSIDEAKDRTKIAPFLAQQSIHLEVWTGAATSTLARFGLDEILPGTVIIDAQGEPITRIVGEAREQDVTSCLDWLLAGRIGPAPEAKLKRY
jgi:thiol-disulfide isomerase/thioredoxin